VTTLAEYRGSRELFLNLTLRELRSKYKRSALGWGWSMVNPLASTIVYTIVFSKFFHAHPVKGYPSGLTQYALWLLPAMLAWNFFQTGITASVGTLIGNGNLIKKTYFPRELMPASAVAAALVSHFIEMGVLLVVMLCFGNFYAAIFAPFTIVIILLVAIFSLGLGLALSVLNVYYRDIQHFLNILFLLWMYATPIIYPNYLVNLEGGSAGLHFLTKHGREYVLPGPAGYRYFPGTHIKFLSVMKINPITEMELLLRQTMWNGTWPDLGNLLYLAAWAFAALWVGLRVFRRFEGRLAEEL
jgi:lipopolysaccharide transport system permease protein